MNKKDLSGSTEIVTLIAKDDIIHAEKIVLL